MRPADQNDAIAAKQADAAVLTDLECPVEAAEIIAVDRGDQYAAETAIHPADALREHDRGPSREARLQRLIDTERVSWRFTMIGEVFPIGIVVVRCLRQR